MQFLDKIQWILTIYWFHYFINLLQKIITKKWKFNSLNPLNKNMTYFLICAKLHLCSMFTIISLNWQQRGKLLIQWVEIRNIFKSCQSTPKFNTTASVTCFEIEVWIHRRRKRLSKFWFNWSTYDQLRRLHSTIWTSMLFHDNFFFFIYFPPCCCFL